MFFTCVITAVLNHESTGEHPEKMSKNRPYIGLYNGKKYIFFHDQMNRKILKETTK